MISKENHDREGTLNTFSDVIFHQKQQIEKLNNASMNLEQKLAFLQSENSRNRSFKESIFYALTECIKASLKKKNTLGHALKGLDEDDSKLIKGILQENNI